MKLDKYANLIILLFFLGIMSNSSADEWKKLKRRLIALGLLHSIRVKTIIPVPLPVPLPVVVKKVTTPLVLPPKKVPFLVPKPVPVYQIIPKFVPIYSDTKSKTKLWSEGDNHLLSQSTTSHEDIMRPSMDTKYDYELIGKLANDYIQKPEFMALSSINEFNKFNLMDHENLQGTLAMGSNPFEVKLGNKKLFKKKRKTKKPKMNKWQDFINYGNEDDVNQYEELLMLSTQPKAKPEASNPYSDQNRSAGNQRHKNSEQPFSAVGPGVRHKQITSNLPKTKGLTSRMPIIGHTNGNATETKKVKVGELRIRSKQLKELLETHQ